MISTREMTIIYLTHQIHIQGFGWLIFNKNTKLNTSIGTSYLST